VALPFLDAKGSYCIGDFDCQFSLMISLAILIALDSKDPKVCKIDGFFAAVDAQTPLEVYQAPFAGGSVQQWTLAGSDRGIFRRVVRDLHK
jgi:hypothetical protein